MEIIKGKTRTQKEHPHVLFWFANVLLCIYWIQEIQQRHNLYFPVIAEKVIRNKQKNHNASSLHTFLCYKMKFNIFMFHYVFVYRAISPWPYNILYFNAFKQFFVYTLKCCTFSFYAVYGIINTMIPWGKIHKSWNKVISELPFNSEYFKNDQSYVATSKNKKKKKQYPLDRLTSHFPHFSPQMLFY